MSFDLGLTNQPGWRVWFNSTDAPEGAFLGTIEPNEAKVTAHISLGRTLDAGRYHVAWKVVDYSGSGFLDFSMGGVSTEVTNLSYSDYNGVWTTPVPIDIGSGASEVVLDLMRSLPVDKRQLYGLRGVYITTSANEVVYEQEDAIVHLELASEVDPSEPIKGNILANGGFEVGMGHGWGLWERDEWVASLWDPSQAYEGTASARIPRWRELVSRGYRLRGNREYTLSAWVRTEGSGQVTLQVDGGNGLLLPPGQPPAVVLKKTFNTTTNWQRFSLSGVLWDYPTGDYHVRILCRENLGQYSWVDAVQLEEGGVSDYSPATALEVGLVSGTAHNLYFDDEAIVMQLRVSNSGNEDASVSIPYKVYDYLNEIVLEGSTNVTVSAAGHWSGNLDLNPGRRGAFRVLLWVDGVDGSREEVSFGVVPRPRTMGVDTNSSIGIHSEFTTRQFDALQRLGIKWNRASSTSQAFRWNVIEPEQGQFVWSDDDMSLAADYGLAVLAVLGVGWPAWADVGGLPDLDAWESFVENVVRHYKGDVKYWEIWNEPQYKLSAGFYGELLKRAVAAINRADPHAQIVGLGGIAQPSLANPILEYLGAEWVAANLDAVSTHLYPKAPLQWYQDFSTVRENYSTAVWNTEAGVWDRGFYTGENSSFLQADGYIWPFKQSARYQLGHLGAAELLAYGFLQSIGYGMERFIYYDARIVVGPASHFTHPTIFEYDDSIRVKGIAYAVLAWLFDHAQGMGDISPDSDSHMYLCNRDGTPIMGLWSSDFLGRQLHLGLEPGQMRVYDMMGNLVTINGQQVPYNGRPVYVEGVGVDVDAFRAAVEASSITSFTDDVPPSVSMVVFPTGATDANPVKMRWLGIDEISSPGDANPDAIDYSYRLVEVDAAWSPWTAETLADYSGLPPGAYQFEVKSRDSSGNVSDPLIVNFHVGDFVAGPRLVVQRMGSKVVISWPGSAGVTYQVLRSVDGHAWTAFGDPIPGTDDTMSVEVPLDASPSVGLFRVEFVE